MSGGMSFLLSLLQLPGSCKSSSYKLVSWCCSNRLPLLLQQQARHKERYKQSHLYLSLCQIAYCLLQTTADIEKQLLASHGCVAVAGACTVLLVQVSFSLLHCLCRCCLLCLARLHTIHTLTACCSARFAVDHLLCSLLRHSMSMAVACSSNQAFACCSFTGIAL